MKWVWEWKSLKQPIEIIQEQMKRTLARSWWPNFVIVLLGLNPRVVCGYQQDMCVMSFLMGFKCEEPLYQQSQREREREKTILNALEWGWKASWIVYRIGHAKDSSCKITVARFHHNWLSYTEAINQRLTQQTSPRTFNFTYLNSA